MKKITYTIIPLSNGKRKSPCYDIIVADLGIDCHLHRVNGQWILSTFDSKIKDADKAHISDYELPTGSAVCPNWNEVISLLQDFN